MKRSRKWAYLPAGFVFALFMVMGAYLMTEVAPMGTAYAAKRLCSCVFISGRAPSSVIGEELKPYWYISTTVDYDDKTVTCSIMGMAARKAIYREGLGSTLEVGMSGDALRKQAEGFIPSRGDRKRLAWPDGDELSSAGLPDGADGAKLAHAVAKAFVEPDPSMPRHTRAVLVVYEGNLVAERYGNGFTKDMPQLGWSMSKSVACALVGVLVKEGRLGTESSAPVPEWKSPGDPRAAITLGQLLRMSSGLSFEEDYQKPTSDVVRMLFAEADSGGYAASKPLEASPGARWHYSSGTTNIVSRIVRQTVGNSPADFFAFPRKALLGRIGMSSAVLEPDPSGTFVGSSFMYATPRDWARFGLFCLNDGVWNGERILPEGWMRYCTTPAPAAPQGKYGAQFWLNAGSPGHPEDRWMPRVPRDMYSLRGFEGQYVTIIPSRKLVVVRMGLSLKEKAWDHEQFLVDVLEALSPSLY